MTADDRGATVREAHIDLDAIEAQIERKDRVPIADLRALVAEVRRLREREQHAIEYERRICWDTTCGNCADVLDESYRQYVRAETAEAALAEVDVSTPEGRDKVLAAILEAERATERWVEP
jgi:hypothetical protein